MMNSTALAALRILNLMSYVVATISLLEFLFFMFRRPKTKHAKDSLANFGIWLIGRPVRAFLTGTVIVTILSAFKPLAIYHLPMTWTSAAITLLAADFIYYWTHRYSHEIRALWAYHSVHHSSNEFNLSTAIRLPWLGAATDALFYIPAVLIGFDPVLLAISKGLVLLYQYWIHSESIGKLGVFDRFFNSPSNHRVHHGSNLQYLDKNHGGILIIWDRMFGTYEPEGEPVKYGLTTPLTSHNPVVINFIEYAHILRDVWRAKGINDKFHYVFGAPGWHPASGQQQSLSSSQQTA